MPISTLAIVGMGNTNADANKIVPNSNFLILRSPSSCSILLHVIGPVMKFSMPN